MAKVGQPTPTWAPGEERYHVCVPMNTPGLKVLSRKSFEAAAVSEYDNPLSTRF